LKSRYKIFNIILLTIVVLLLLETSLKFLGRLYLYGNNFKAAKICLSLVRDKDLLGLIFYKQDKFEDAYKYYQKRNDWKGMGWAYYGMGKYEEAEDYFNRVNDFSGLGQVKLAQGKIREAKLQFEHAEEKSGIGLTYLVDNDFQAAKESFIQSKDILGYGLTFLAKGDLVSAKTIFNKIGNNTVQGLLSLIDNKYEDAREIFKKLNNYNMLASFFKLTGEYDKAYSLYKNNNIKQLINLYIELAEIEKAKVLLNTIDYDYGYALLYEKLGFYERAFEFFNKTNHFEKAVSSLIKLNHQERLQKYKSKLIANKKYSKNIQLLFAEFFAINGSYEEASKIIQALKKESSMKSVALLLEERIKMIKGDDTTLTRSLQQAVNLAGNGFLSDSIIATSSILGISIKHAEREALVDFIPLNPLKFIKILFALIVIVIFIVILFYFIKKRLDKPPETEDNQFGFSGVSDAHKIIYSDKTSLNASTVLKIKNRKLQEEKKNKKAKSTTISPSKPKADKEHIKVEAGKAQNKLEKSGAQILQLALKKIGITSSAFELIELSGENADKLSVYGIYLAVKAKGAQVQGIKVNFNYFKENKDSVHLVFFHDDDFALLESLQDNTIELSQGLNNVFDMSIELFKEKWNGYVITISKS